MTVLVDASCLLWRTAQAVQSLVWHHRRIAGGDDCLRDDEYSLLAFKAELLLPTEYGQRSYCLATAAVESTLT